MSALNNGFMSGSLKLVLVGLGLVGKRHADVIAKTKSAELVAIVDPSKDAQNYARKKSLKAYHSLEICLRSNVRMELYLRPQR
jgi:myo-inositol 2-dehydrogenase/D-chiro-inositol 1-dehydrogenase